MLLKSAWLNREKVAFLAMAVGLAGAGVYSFTSEPSTVEGGKLNHRVGKAAPGPLTVRLDKARPEDIRKYLAGPRANPYPTFLHWR